MFRKKNDDRIPEDNDFGMTIDQTDDSEAAEKKESRRVRFKNFFQKKKKEEEPDVNIYKYDSPEDETDSGEDVSESENPLYIQEEEFDQQGYEKDVEKFRLKYVPNGEEEYEEGELEEVSDLSDEADEVMDADNLEDSTSEESDLSGLEENGRRKFSKKKILVTVVAGLVIVIGVIYFMVTNLSGGSDSIAYVELVETIAGLGSANGASNRYTGEVEAQDSWDISLDSDLSVEECYVSVGDEVKEGDKLFIYNTEELALSKEKKELEIDTLESENKQLNEDIATYQTDLKTASSSETIELQTEILTAQTTIKKNEYTIEADEEDIKELEEKINDATVTSKMDGVVQSINTSLESSSGDDTDDSDYSDSSVYMSILAIGDYRVKVTISETNISAISEGDAVIVRSRVDDTATWSGTISKISTDSTADSSSESDEDYYYYDDSSSNDSASSYYFYVELDGDDGLMMGQHVLVEEDYGQDEERDGLWIPAAYVHIEDDTYYVWAANSSNRLELREISVGEYDEDLDEYEILDGLELTDYIACDADYLEEGMKTTTVASEADSTGYYDEETSDDDLDYGDEEYYDDEDYYYDEEYDYDDEDYYYDDEDYYYDDTDYDDTDYEETVSSDTDDSDVVDTDDDYVDDESYLEDQEASEALMNADSDLIDEGFDASEFE